MSSGSYAFIALISLALDLVEEWIVLTLRSCLVAFHSSVPVDGADQQAQNEEECKTVLLPPDPSAVCE